jgi:hypothetical protein
MESLSREKIGNGQVGQAVFMEKAYEHKDCLCQTQIVKNIAFYSRRFAIHADRRLFYFYCQRHDP